MIDTLANLDASDAFRVDETGLAVVHEGEWVVPVDGAAAELSRGSMGTVIEIPIEITVVTSLSAEDRAAIADQALADLRLALDAERGL